MFALLAACGGSAHGTATNAAPGTCDLSGFLATQHAHANRDEVLLCGTVTRVRPVRVTRSGAHRVFFVDVGRHDTIEVDANVDIMGNFPIATGEPVTVRGEYYFDGGGREGVHFTHHASSGRHESGFVILGDHRYQ